jgi:hypothetical protein
MQDNRIFLLNEKADRLALLYLENDTVKVSLGGKYFYIGRPTLSDYLKTKGTYYSGGAGLSFTVKIIPTF